MRGLGGGSGLPKQGGNTCVLGLLTSFEGEIFSIY